MPATTSEQVFRELIALLENGVYSIPEQPKEEDLIPLRDRIDAFDRAILVLLNERSRCANLIGQIKKRIGLPIYVPNREDEVLSNVMTANLGPLSDTAVKRLFERIIDETRSLERHLYQDETEPFNTASDAKD